MNLSELRERNPAELRKLPQEELVEAILEGQTYTVTVVPLTKDEYGNNVEHEWEVRRAYDGNLVSRHRVEWTYHDAKRGVVDGITVREGNRERIISHSRNGKVLRQRQRIVAEETVGDRVFEAAAGGVTGAASGIGAAIKRLLSRGS